MIRYSPAPPTANRLSLQTSPYLLQHANNPVDWHPWGPEALALAAAEDRPILLSVGYSACHWCHVMERESPFAHTALVAPGTSPAQLPWMADESSTDAAVTAYLCRNRTCLAPTSDLDQWRAQLDRTMAELEPKGAGRVHAPALPDDPARWLNTEAPLSIARLAGKVVVLDFWTYCCINCLHVLPELAAVEARFHADPVQIIGVHSAKFSAQKVLENVARAVRRHRIQHPVVLDADHDIWDAYTVKAWPTVIVLDKSGRIAWQKSGEVGAAELARVVGRTLNEDVATPVAYATWPATQLASSAASKVEVSSGGLLFPGKVQAWPDAMAQATGAEPFGADARLYIADSGHHQVIEASLLLGADGWPVVDVARQFGSGAAALTDGPAASAAFFGPQGLSRLGGEPWVADTENHALRAVDLEAGEVRTVAGTGVRGSGGKRDPSRPKAHPLRSPWDVVAMDGGVLVAMAGAHQIWVYLTADDKIGPLIGSGAEGHVDGPSDDAALAQPSALVAFGKHLFWVDSETSSVRLADLDQHAVATVLGRGLFDFGDIDGDAEQARLQHPLGIAVAQGSEVFVADTFNNKVKVISLADGSIRTLVGGDAEVLCEPGGLTIAGQFLIVADTGNHRLRAIRRTDGETRTIEVMR